MSGSNIDDDTLISQDDIDKLLNSSFLDEAESAISDSDDELGELSQNDIDTLLNNVSLDVDPFESKPSSGPAAEPEEDDLELVSQDDIDQLMNSMLPDERPPARPDEPKADEPEEDDLELVSQDDIDRLMNSMLSDEQAPAGPDEPKADEPKVYEPEEDDMELVSQDDIDRLMNSMASDEPAPSRPDEPVSARVAEPKAPEPDEDDMELVSQDDIDSLMDSVLSDDKPSDSMDGPEKNIIETDDEILIDESQSVDIDKSLITQEIIDRLLAEPIPEPIPESISESISEPEPDMDEFSFPDTVPPKAISKEPDMPEGNIDELLQGLGDIADLDGNDLISQDDIDELLKGSEEEDEDIIGDLDADMDFSMDSEESDPEEHQVVLEEAEENGDSDEESFGTFLGKPVPSGKWYRSKKVLALCSAALVLVVALSLGLFKFFTAKEVTVVSPLQVAEVLSPPEPQVEVVAIDLVEKETATGPGTLVLENFVLLAPGKAIGISYITASVSIDYLDGRAAAEINRHLPLYRDIIFDAMGNALGSITVDKITEADLLGNIKEALNRVLPGQYVERVTFAAFTTG